MKKANTLGTSNNFKNRTDSDKHSAEHGPQLWLEVKTGNLAQQRVVI